MYELLIGLNPNYPEYRDGIFDTAGLVTLLVAIALCALFYVALGRWRGVWYTTTHWFITVALCALVGFGIAYGMATAALNVADAYVVRFALINGIYLALFFVVFSFLFKNFSIYAKRTPFGL